MCTNGVNTGQFEMMLEQMDDQIALNRRWVHKMFHAADDAKMANTAASLKEIQMALDSIRAELSEARDAVNKDAQLAADVSVKLV